MDIPVRYKEVPTGTCELDPNVKSYSGYVDVAEDQHYFFWFLYVLPFLFSLVNFASLLAPSWVQIRFQTARLVWSWVMGGF